MNTNFDTSRVASLVDDLRTTDWERKLGSWTTTLLALTATWWLLRRVRNTAQAVNGEREMPTVLPESITHILFPLDMVIVASFAAIAWGGAMVAWWIVGRKYRINSFPRRFVSVAVAGSVGLTALLYLLAVPIEVYEGARIASALTGNLDESRDFLRDWVVYLPIPVVATSLVASWRHGELELGGRRRQFLAVVVAVIIVVPGILGAAGIGGAVADDESPDIEPRTESSDIVDQMDDGLTGPTTHQLAESTLSQGEFQQPTALLGCGAVNRSVYRLDTYMHPDYPAATTVNISEPADADQQYIELAPYRDDGKIVHGRYSFRVAGDEWTLLETWYGNPKFEGGHHWNATTGAYHTYDESGGIVAMENTEAATFGFDLVNDDGEIIRVQYRLCRPDAT